MKEYDSNAFGGTFAFLPTHKTKQKCKRATKPTHHDRPMNGQTTYRQKGRTANKVLPQWGLTCFYETFVLKRTAVHLLNICANNPPLRQYPNRYMLLLFDYMFLKKIIVILFLLSVISCTERNSNNEAKLIEPILKDSLLTNTSVDTPLATWASHSTHAFQLLELKDSLSATVYYYIDGYTNPNKIESPYYFKAKGKVALWTKNQITIATDKFKFYYNIWNDTLILSDEAGIQEKLIRVYNDTVMRNQTY